jgi:hypothetical protein
MIFSENLYPLRMTRMLAVSPFRMMLTLTIGASSVSSSWVAAVRRGVGQDENRTAANGR